MQPGFAPSGIAHGPANHCVGVVEAKQLTVVQRISIGVRFHGTDPVDFNRPSPLENLVVGEHFDLAVDEVSRAPFTRHDYVARVPSYGISQRVDVGIGSGQTATVQLEAFYRPPARPYLLNGLHRRHVVDPGIESRLVEYQNAAAVGVHVEVFHPDIFV